MYGSDDSLVTAGLLAQLSKDLHRRSGAEIAVRIEQFALDIFNCTQVNVLEIAGHREAEPAQDALASGDFVVVPDTFTENRWPHWATVTAELGLRSALVVPLVTGGSVPGILELFSVKPYRFEAADVSVALALSGHAAVAMQAARQEASLRQAMEAHRLSGQATGILMERYGIAADRAFDVLRRHSQDNNVKLRDVSRGLIETGLLPNAGSDRKADAGAARAAGGQGVCRRSEVSQRMG